MTYRRQIFSSEPTMKSHGTHAVYSGKDGLELVSDAVDELWRFGSPMREHPEDLLAVR